MLVNEDVFCLIKFKWVRKNKAAATLQNTTDVRGFQQHWGSETAATGNDHPPPDSSSKEIEEIPAACVHPCASTVDKYNPLVTSNDFDALRSLDDCEAHRPGLKENSNNEASLV